MVTTSPTYKGETHIMAFQKSCSRERLSDKVLRVGNSLHESPVIDNAAKGLGRRLIGRNWDRRLNIMATDN